MHYNLSENDNTSGFFFLNPVKGNTLILACFFLVMLGMEDSEILNSFKIVMSTLLLYLFAFMVLGNELRVPEIPG